MRSVLFALTLLLIGGSAANAACTCLCVDGRMQPLCDGVIDPPKVCPPTVCRPPKPSVAPVIPPNLLTLGGSQCRQAQVCDTSGKCAWEQVCRSRRAGHRHTPGTCRRGNPAARTAHVRRP